MTSIARFAAAWIAARYGKDAALAFTDALNAAKQRGEIRRAPVADYTGPAFRAAVATLDRKREARRG